MKYLKNLGRFLYDFYIGDDWRIAASVVGVLAISAILVVTETIGDTAVMLIAVAGISLAFAADLIVDVARDQRRTRSTRSGN